MSEITDNLHVALNNARNLPRTIAERIFPKTPSEPSELSAVKIRNYSHTFHYEDAADFMAQMDALLAKMRQTRMTPIAEVRAQYPNLSDTAFYNRLGRFPGKFPREMSPTGQRTVKLFVTPELHTHLSK